MWLHREIWAWFDRAMPWTAPRGLECKSCAPETVAFGWPCASLCSWVPEWQSEYPNPVTNVSFCGMINHTQEGCCLYLLCLLGLPQRLVDRYNDQTHCHHSWQTPLPVWVARHCALAANQKLDETTWPAINGLVEEKTLQGPGFYPQIWGFLYIFP